MSVRLRARGAAALTLALAGASRADPVTVIDGTGAVVALPAPARRIVSLAPSATELLYAAGAGDRVVAVTEPADWPPEAAQRPRVGDARALDLERIVSLAPQLAVAWTHVTPAQNERLQALGIPIYRTDPHTPEAIALDIERLGALSGAPEGPRPAPAALRSRPAARACQRRASVRGWQRCVIVGTLQVRFACSTRSGTSPCIRSEASTSSARRSSFVAAKTSSGSFRCRRRRSAPKRSWRRGRRRSSPEPTAPFVRR